MKFAIVTGANKGVGLGIVRTFTQKLTPSTEWTVILTARNSELGVAAADQFKEASVKVVFQQLDITSSESIEKFTHYVKANLSGIDILVNNAAISHKSDSTVPLLEQAVQTLETNFWGTLNITNALLPFFNKHARIVFISSLASTWALQNIGDELYDKFTSPMTMEQLKQHMQDYVKHVNAGDYEAVGWLYKSYAVSKLGVTKLVFILHEQLQNDPRKLVINACCPGYVDTDMTRHRGTKTIDEGADTPTYLALLPNDSDIPNGKFVFDRVIQEWKK